MAGGTPDTTDSFDATAGHISYLLTKHGNPNRSQHPGATSLIFLFILLFRQPVFPVYDHIAAYGDISVPEMNNRRFFFAFGASNSRRAAGLQ